MSAPATEMSAAAPEMSPPVSQMPTPAPAFQNYSAHIPTSSLPVSSPITDTPAPTHPAPVPRSSPQPTASSVTTSRDTSYSSQFAPPAEESDETTTGEFYSEAVVPELVIIGDEYVEHMQMRSGESSSLLPQETLHPLTNEENIILSNLVTTTQPSPLPSTILDKANSPLSMLALSDNLNNLSPGYEGRDSMPGSSKDGDL